MIEILKSGSQMRIVDTGRSGYRRYGVSEGGAMDIQSFLSAQSIVGNPAMYAALELYESGHRIRFEKATTIALAGASGNITLNSRPINSSELITVNKNDTLSVGKLHHGCRLYMSVGGGLKSKLVMKSYSTLLGIHDTSLQSGIKIAFANKSIIQSSSRIKPISIDLSAPIKCSVGPEYHLLTKAQKTWLVETSFNIDRLSNTMGYRLHGVACPSFHALSINTSPVICGTVQLPPNGLPLVLMRDAQTTGGYPRILVISDNDINQLAQRRPGDQVRFELI